MNDLQPQTRPEKKKTRFRLPSGSVIEEQFVEVFTDAFGIEQADYLYPQYPFTDIYQNTRYADFILEKGGGRVAFEIDDDASHHPGLVSFDKHTDDLLKQNSMVFLGWDVYRWTARQIIKRPEDVKEELLVFLGQNSHFRAIDDYLPPQIGKALDASSLELHEHQQAALDSLENLRRENASIALLYHATGTGKTVTAVCDAKRMGGRVLFVAHTMELVEQARQTFQAIWPEVEVGKFADNERNVDAHVICGSVQSVALNLDLFRYDSFDYLIVDEAHHATAETYRKILAHFRPSFTLGLTATPERADDNDILEIFQRTAHKLDPKRAVEIGALVPVRCFRIKTNIDISSVRFNGTRYNARDLDQYVHIVERDQLIVDTWLEYIRNKRTVVFCTSVEHAKSLAQLFQDSDVKADYVYGGQKTSYRKELTDRFVSGELKVLCSCDLLNEGWDCPETEVLFMARPTMSKLLYLQQLGRGMRCAPNKDCLVVFDFVDAAGAFNAPYSMHRVFKLKEYRPGGLVLASPKDREQDDDLYRRGERPEIFIDYPYNIQDIELLDIYDWQEEAAGMISKMELVRRVDVQPESVYKKITEGRLKPDLVVPTSEKRSFMYFKEETLQAAAKEFGWKLIDDSNRKDLFMKMVEIMDMSYSYKPVFLTAMIKFADEKGRVKIDNIIAYFRQFYANRRAKGLFIEKSNSVFAREVYTDKEAERTILTSPFARFEYMSAMRLSKTLGLIEFDKFVWKKLTDEDKEKCLAICEAKLKEYYDRFPSEKMDLL